MAEASRKTLIKYDSRDVESSFWQKLYGYSKGKYEYPGLLDEIPGAERLAEALIAVPEDKAEVLKDFLRKHGAEFEERGSMSSASEDLRSAPSPECAQSGPPGESGRSRREDG